MSFRPTPPPLLAAAISSPCSFSTQCALPQQILLPPCLLPCPCRLQQADVNDPWLQQEWGLMLVASGRTQEALAHLEVAGGVLKGWGFELYIWTASWTMAQ